MANPSLLTAPLQCLLLQAIYFFKNFDSTCNEICTISLLKKILGGVTMMPLSIRKRQAIIKYVVISAWFAICFYVFFNPWNQTSMDATSDSATMGSRSEVVTELTTASTRTETKVDVTEVFRCGGKRSDRYFCIGTNYELCHEMDNLYNGGSLKPSMGKLCKIMDKANSDKCHRHNYTNIYEMLFEKYLGKSIDLLEIGLGTNNTDVESNMGSSGTPGASHRGWREYFPMAQIYGGDVDGRVLFEEIRITTFYVDILNNATIDAMFRHFGVESYDIIIDDSYHTVEAQVNFVLRAIPKLKQSGIFVTEDILIENCNQFLDNLDSLKNLFKISLVHTDNTTPDSILGIFEKI